MITSNQAKKQKINNVDCKNCSMQDLCTPLKAGKNEISIMDNYLSKHNVVNVATALFIEKETVSAIYAVCAGSFKLTTTSLEGKEKVIGFRFPGEIIGEEAIHNRQYDYNAIATDNTMVCRVDISTFNEYAKLMPELLLNLVSLLSKQNSTLRKELTSIIAKNTAESLLAAFIINIFQRNTLYQNTGTKLHLSLSRDAIANHLGFRRETLSRILSRFQHNGLLFIKAKDIVLVDLVGLEKVAYS